MSEKLSYVVTFRARPGQEDELCRRLTGLIAPTRAEPGCINYDLHRSTDDRSVYMLYENWRSKADLDAHLASPMLQDFIGRLGEVLAEDFDLRTYEMLTVQVPPRQ